jgi:hypothetical protein
MTLSATSKTLVPGVPLDSKRKAARYGSIGAAFWVCVWETLSELLTVVQTKSSAASMGSISYAEDSQDRERSNCIGHSVLL